MSRMQVTRIWNTTRLRVMKATVRPVLPRPDSLRASEALAREETHAGIRPETRAATSVAATVKASTLPSMLKVM